MTAALFTTSALRLNPADLYEFQDARSGAIQARLVEVARVRSPRGSFLTMDRVQTPRLTFAVKAPDGSTLMYADRAEHLKLNPVAPQMAFVGPDGTVLGRVEFDSHSLFQGGGRILATTEQGLRLSAGARLLDAKLRPFADLVYELPPDPAFDRPTMPDGRDARGIRWMAPNSSQPAVRRNGDLYIDDRITGVLRALIIGSIWRPPSNSISRSRPAGRRRRRRRSFPVTRVCTPNTRSISGSSSRSTANPPAHGSRPACSGRASSGSA